MLINICIPNILHARTPHTRYYGVILAKKSSKKLKEKLEHNLVPQHILLTDEEKQKVFSKFSATAANFPRIDAADPALIGTEAKPGDLVLIKRKDATGSYDYYRLVTKG